ncbi:Metallo-beta-lactamase superfamily protein [Mycoplasma haemocanis str. Illinois]|uniref:Metallo-beta-lactamase superfamily protein n=1 Tax=Mycoplasma haemocanis (strain Illinois) TaxID=1111676 RepID=H6N5G0_MYCHN|nr:ribonuclease J [Mycoplasma haemocanis]AEW44920.1 Metallo-beta-lactamase superfamily protein [Mycoplasma haemocanis str. Illinois]
MGDSEKILDIGGLEEGSLESLDQKLKNLNNQVIPTKFFALGGVEEIGKNTYCVEHDDEIIVIDAGIKFVNRKHFPGLSGVIPSLSYLKKNQHKIKALVITHGHEDHIGGIVHVLKEVNFPVIYSPIMASELVKRKVADHKLPAQNIVLYSPNSVFFTKHFAIDFYKVNHSIPDSFGLCLVTPNGVIVSSGDFRFDFASKNDKFDLQKISAISTRGVDLLLCESTNAEQPGFNESEKVVINEIHNIMSSTKGRIIITFFASNIGRIEEIFKIAVNLNKKIIILGHSIDSNVTASKNVGYLKVNENIIISPKDINSYPDDEILIICTGSQGEENSALNNISKNKHPTIKLKSSDSIIFSSNVIPGNTAAVEGVINRLHKSGCNIYLNSSNLKIHSSGHASKLEQQLFVSLVNPKYIVPIHGETRMMKALARNCVEIGFNEKNIFIVKNGDVVHLLNGVVSVSDEKIDASLLYIDGDETTSEGESISKKRTELGAKGLVVLHILLDSKKSELHLISPIANAGSFFLSESVDFVKKLSSTVQSEIKNLLKSKKTKTEISAMIASLLAKEIYSEKKQKPNVEIIVTDVSKEDIFKDPILPKQEEATVSSESQTPS